MDWKKLGPLALAALVMTVLPFRLTPAGPAAQPLASANATAGEGGSGEPPASRAATSERALGLLGELTGDPAAALDPTRDLVLPAHTRLEFLLATVPDPLDTTLALDFDLSLDGLQRGFAAESFLLDRFSLPWHEASAAREHAYRQEPGAMLFRRAAAGESVLYLVLLVGETPRQGIHAAAFDRAVATQRDLERRTGTATRPLEILGPYFSGTVDSLARALSRTGELGATVVSGAATGSHLEEPFERLGTGARFQRAAPADSVLLGRTLCALQERLGLTTGTVALLVESDTAYGESLGRADLDCDLEPLVVRFSGRLSSLRAALGRRIKEKPRESTAEVELTAPPQTELELDLVAPGRAVDVVGELSRDSADLDDLALANLIRHLSAEGYRFVGLVSTDPMDKLYLGRRLRQLAPDLLLFTFNNSLLYAHPQAGAALDGTLVITSVPLVPESPDGESRLRQQLATETQSGVLRATRALVGAAEQREERLAEGQRFGWVVAVGGGSFWPIVSVPLGHDASGRLPGPTGVHLTGRVVLVLGLVVALLGFAAAWLHRTAPPRRSDRPEAREPVGGEPAWQGRWLLAGGLSVLALAGWVALVVALLSIEALAAGGPIVLLVLVALALVFTLGSALGLRIAARFRGQEAHPVAPRALPGGEPQWIPAGLVLLPAVGWLLIEGWTGGQVDYRFFYQRAVTVTSGLSPLVSLAFLGLGLFGWLLLQLKRLRASARHAVAFPRPALGEADGDLAATAELAAREIGPLLVGALPPWANRRFWGALLALVLFVVGAVAPRDVVRPLAETVGYGRFYLAGVLLMLVLGALSWYRFVRLWRELRRTLARVPPELLTGLAQDSVIQTIGWNPMRSFAWTIPKFHMARITAEEAERRLPDGDDRAAIRAAKRAMLAALASHDFEAEVGARRRLQDAFERLDADPVGVGWEAFRAYRFAAYLRYVFEILRNQLLTTVWLGLTALGAVSFYDYHPRYLLTLAVGGALMGLAGAALVTFYQMETDPTLSAVAGVKPTQVKSWGQLIVNVLSYVLVPLLALLASRIPLLGDLFRQLGNPLLQSMGGS